MDRPIGDSTDGAVRGTTAVPAPVPAPVAAREGGPVAEPLPRRTVLRAGLAVPAAAAGAALAACANSGSDDPPDPDTTGRATVLIALDKVPIGGVAAVTVDRKPAFVARPGADSVTAFSAVCTHQGCTVVAAGEQLMCPCHGSRFALLTGEVLRGPAEKPLPPIGVRLSGDSVIRA